MLQPTRTYSPYAPPALAGLPMLDDADYTYRPHTYVFFKTDIDANATITGLYQTFDNDSDFFWRGICASSRNTSATTGCFAARFMDPYGVYISDDFISGLNFSSFFLAEPFPLVPALFCPSGSRIQIDLQDQSGLGSQAVLINFIGVKRFRNG